MPFRADGATFIGTVDMTGTTDVNIPTNPSSSNSAASKAYVDSVAQGLDVKQSCRVATAAALVATRSADVLTANANGSINTAGIDGVTDLALNDRVMVKDQGASHIDNGLYEVTALGDASNPWTLTRTDDADADSEVTAGLFSFIEEGTTNADTGWVVQTNDPITVNTTAFGFVQFSGAGSYTAGDGIDLTGGTFSADVSDFAGAGLEDDGSNDLRIAAAAAGDGLQGGGGTALAVDVSDFAGSGLEDDGSENLRIAAAAAGDGLQGGAGSALAVDVSDFAGAGLEDDGTENLRIAAAAAGAGLGGGAGSALAVGDADKGVQVNADDLEVDASEIAGDGLKQNVTNSYVLDIEPADFAGTGLEDDGSDDLRLAAQGNGIAGGAGSVLSVQADSTTGGNIQAANVVANGVGVDIAAIAGTGVEADGSANLRLAAQGNGLAGGAGSVLSIDVDSETGGNIQPANLTANGVGLDVSAIAGTNLEADGSANLRIAAAAAGDGLQGGGADALAVDVSDFAGTGLEDDGAENLRLAAQGTGISGGAGSVLSIDTTASIDYSSGGGVHTHSPDTLQVVGTPDSGNDSVNKSYVDGLISGLSWREPVHTINMKGDNLLTPPGSPADCDSYLMPSGTLTGAWSTFLEGNMAVWDASGSAWVRPHGTSDFNGTAGLRFVVADTVTASSTFDTDVAATKIATTVGDGSFTYETPVDGWSVLVHDHATAGPCDSLGFVYDGDTAPYWVQFTGAGQITAGTGISRSGNTINVGDVDKGVQVNADDLEIDASEIAGDGLKQNVTNSYVLDVEPADFAGAGLEDDGSDNLRIAAAAAGDGLQGGAGSALAVDVSDFAGTGLEDDGSENLRIAAAAAGAGLGGGAGSALAVGDVNKGVQVNADDLEVDASEIAGDGLKQNVTNSYVLDVEPADFAGTGLEDDGSDNLRIAAAAAGNGITGGGGSALAVQAEDSTIAVGASGIKVGTNTIDENYLTTSVAGTGLSGGNGTPLSVDYGTGTGAAMEGDRVQTGRATFTAANSVAVSGLGFSDTNYSISITVPDNVAAYVTSKGNDGFTINTSANITGDVDWLVITDA